MINPDKENPGDSIIVSLLQRFMNGSEKPDPADLGAVRVTFTKTQEVYGISISISGIAEELRR